MCPLQTWGNFFNDHSVYTPSQEDVNFGDLVRRHWLSLAVNGTTESDWLPAGKPGALNTAILGADVTGGALTMTVNHKVQLCDTLASNGLDSRYWWLN